MSASLVKNHSVQQDQISDAVPHLTIVRPSELRRDHLILLISNGAPLIGTIFAIVLAVFYGISTAVLWICFAMFIVGMLGMEVGCHRLFSHRAFKTTDGVRVFLGIAACMATQGPVTSWVSNHRMHHAYTDRDGDTHSPHVYRDKQLGVIEGLWHAHFGWMFSPERAYRGRYARDLLSDPIIRKIDRFYFFWVGLGLIVPALAAGWLTSSLHGFWEGFLWGGLVRTCLVQQLTYGVNSICHYVGVRPYESNDKSTNNLSLSIVTLGASLHNNHHAFPRTAKNAFHWYQIDLSWWFIRGLQRCGLVWDVHVPSAAELEKKLKIEI